MSTGIIVVIVVIVIVVAGAVAAAASSAARRRRLQERFGPEYDRVVDESSSRRGAEAELALRERRVSDLGIRPLDPVAQARYLAEWATIQEQFVDAPQSAAAQAQGLVVAVVNERGYPTEHRDQLLADLSVEHSAFLDHYRAATDISERATAGTASTEDLRQAMIHYRALFQELLGQPANAGLAAPGQAPAASTDAELAAADRDLAPVDGDLAAAARSQVADTRPDPADTPLDPANSDLAAGANPEAADPESAMPRSTRPSTS
jgi:hypothetical protein